MAGVSRVARLIRGGSAMPRKANAWLCARENLLRRADPPSPGKRRASRSANEHLLRARAHNVGARSRPCDLAGDLFLNNASDVYHPLSAGEGDPPIVCSALVISFLRGNTSLFSFDAKSPPGRSSFVRPCAGFIEPVDREPSDFTTLHFRALTRWLPRWLSMW